MATISKYQTASGATLYRVRYRTPDNRQTDKRGFTTKRDAEQFANNGRGRQDAGDYIGAVRRQGDRRRTRSGVAAAPEGPYEAVGVPVL